MKQEKKNKTDLSSLGEFGLIDHLTGKLVLKNKSSVTGVGDDAAVLDYKEKCVVVSTDLLLEGIHFNLVYTPLKHLGYKAIIANLSDIYAMNAIPGQITVSIGLSARFGIEDVDELYEGIRLACDGYGVDLVGGDTSSSMTGMLISITVIGSAAPANIVYRRGARPGDLICVTGDLGAAYIGLQVLEREKHVFESDRKIEPRLEGYDYILERQLKPEARKDIIELFGQMQIVPHAMIDISDGLSSDLIHICKQSGAGCRIYADRIPVHPLTRKVADEFNMTAETAALNGGEDYELLFTLTPGDYRRLEGINEITLLGEITEEKEGILLVTSGGNEVRLTAQGWDQMSLRNDHS